MSTNVSIQPDAGRQGTLFCIDCGDYMFEVNDNDTEKRTHMVIALKAIRNEMNLMCLSADLRQQVGIIFFNTVKTNIDAQGLDNIMVYRNMVEFNENGFMKSLDSDAVKQIDDLIKDEKKRKELFEKTLGGSGSCDYSQLLWLIRRLFRYDLKAQKKAAFIFSRNKFMEDYEETLMAKIRLEIDEAKSADIQITHMLLGEEDIAEHWDSLDVETEVFDSADTLTLGIKRRNVARRAATTIPLQFGKDINLAVSIYYLISEQKRETGVYLNEATNNLVRCKTRYVKQPTLNEKMSLSRIVGEEDDGPTASKRESVDEKNIKLTHKVGGTEIEFAKEELENFKRIDNPGVYIIGFKPMKYLKTSHQIGPTQYLFPNEELINGSTVMYRALLSRCLARNLFILARFVLKRNTMPKLVALVPQRKGDPDSEETDVENLFYEGFHVVHLPFAEDKRNLQSKLEGEWPEPDNSQVKAVETFIEKLTTKFSPETYCNPLLQKHYYVLEGLATENDELDNQNHEFDQIKPYFEKTNRGKEEALALESKLP